jgi:hypothetical protein
MHLRKTSTVFGMICPAATGPLPSAEAATKIAETQHPMVECDMAAQLVQGDEVIPLWELDSPVETQERRGSGREAIEALDSQQMAEKSLPVTLVALTDTSSTSFQRQHDVVPLPFDVDITSDDHTFWQSHNLLINFEGRSKETQVSRTGV